VGDRQEFVKHQYPYLPSSHPAILARFKPLYRLEIKEIREYCRIKDIRPVQGSCPYTAGATSHYFREALEYLEGKMPGTKRGLLFNYLRKPKELGLEGGFTPCAGSASIRPRPRPARSAA
jgi:tRNA(Ile)-lysidine synthase TilS/MesJ